MKLKYKGYTLKQQGEYKEIQQTVNNNVQLRNSEYFNSAGPWVGELIQVLYEKGVLSKEDIFKMLPEYEEYDASKHQ